MTAAEALRNQRDWTVRAASRRRKLRWYTSFSKRPKDERKKLIDKWLKNVREAEAKVAHYREIYVRESGVGRAREFYAACAGVSAENRPYVYGGGHGVNASQIGVHQGLDCSSSTWLAMIRAKVTTFDYAPHSSKFGSLPGMERGPGKFVSIYYNNNHAWTRFHGLGRYWRFDTSPWGSGGRGPRMRVGPRSTSGFNVCHPHGM